MIHHAQPYQSCQRQSQPLHAMVCKMRIQRLTVHLRFTTNFITVFILLFILHLWNGKWLFRFLNNHRGVSLF